MARRYGLRVAPLSFYGANPLKLLRSFGALIRLVKREKIDIINTHRSEDHSFGLLAKLFCPVRLVITRGDQRPIKSNCLARLRYGLADAVVLTCRQILKDNERVFLPKASQVHVIYGSVDEAHFQPQASPEEIRVRYGLPGDKILVGMIGRLSHVKDQSRFVTVAIALAQSRDDLHFLVAGKEVDLSRAELERRVAAAGVAARFTFLGQVDDIAGLMQEVEIGAVISVASETISRVLLEFMYLGKAVVATHINAIGEIVVPGVTGERIPPGESRALAHALFKLADQPALRKTYARNAQTAYHRDYAETAFYHRYLAVFTAMANTEVP
jgi:glycosyltransferase involved in cell wall biosynthesis